MERNGDFKQMEEIKHFKNILDNYKEYKTGYSNDKGSSVARQTKLHWVQIYFATPNFLRITKDEKANFVAKLSAIGGTMGLLTGFSIISGLEIFYHAVKIFVAWFKKVIKNTKNKVSLVKEKKKTNIIVGQVI